MNNLRLCIQCDAYKNISDFLNLTKNTIRPCTVCKDCIKRNSLAYNRTPKGRVLRMYTSQKHSSKQRGHNPPSYTKSELFIYVTTHPDFTLIFKEWEDSGYDKYSSPSIDRLDDFKGYSMDNIRLVPYKDNFDKGHRDRLKGIGTCGKNSCLAVVQLTKDDCYISEYHSASEASRNTGVQVTGILRTAHGKRKTAGGFRWKFKEPSLHQYY